MVSPESKNSWTNIFHLFRQKQPEPISSAWNSRSRVSYCLRCSLAFHTAKFHTAKFHTARTSEICRSVLGQLCTTFVQLVPPPTHTLQGHTSWRFPKCLVPFCWHSVLLDRVIEETSIVPTSRRVHAIWKKSRKWTVKNCKSKGRIIYA